MHILTHLKKYREVNNIYERSLEAEEIEFDNKPF